VSKLKVEICVPDDHVPAILAALEAVGAGRVGRYDQVTSFWQIGGTWKPMPGANPYDGEIGTLMTGTETRVESECDRATAPAVLKALREAHPYEEPIIRFVPLYQPDASNL
jgi:hypothetical protein